MITTLQLNTWALEAFQVPLPLHPHPCQSAMYNLSLALMDLQVSQMLTPTILTPTWSYSTFLFLNIIPSSLPVSHKLALQANFVMGTHAVAAATVGASCTYHSSPTTTTTITILTSKVKSASVVAFSQPHLHVMLKPLPHTTLPLSSIMHLEHFHLLTFTLGLLCPPHYHHLSRL